MTNPNIKLYGKNDAETINWPDNEWGFLVKRFLSPIISLGPEALIDNAASEIMALKVDEIILPIVLNGHSENNSYLCSPYNHYISYAYEELEKIDIRLSKPIAAGCLNLLGKFLRAADIDKNISVNDWLLPTNIYPELKTAQIDAITRFLVKKYPDHAILFRSINDRHPLELKDILSKLGFVLVPSRMVYFTDTSDDQAFKSRMFKSDMKVMVNSPYRMVEDMETLNKAVSRIKELYWELNIEKYSRLNPQFNDQYIRHAIESGWMSFKAFERDGRIDAVFGYLEAGSVMTSPLFGCDLAKELEHGLYRLISTQLLLEAKRKGKLLNQSAGAGHYKKLRRAESHKEYMAVYCSHLPYKRRAAWRTLAFIMETFGKHFLEKI